MEAEKTSKIEKWLKQLFGDIGNLAVAVHAMGGFKPTIEKENPEETNQEAEVKEKPRKVLHPSMLKQRPGDFLIPPRYDREL